MSGTSAVLEPKGLSNRDEIAIAKSKGQAVPKQVLAATDSQRRGNLKPRISEAEISRLALNRCRTLW